MFDNDDNDALFPDDNNDDAGTGYNDGGEDGSQNTGIDPNEFQSVKAELDNLKQWQQNALRAFGGQPPEHQEQSPFTADPNVQAFVGHITQQTLAAVRQEQFLTNLQNQFQAANPDLAPFKDYIFHDAEAIAQQHLNQGKSITAEQAIQEATKAFKSKLNPGGANAQALQHMALKMDTGAPSNTGFKQLSGDDIFNMPPEQFEQFRAQIHKQRGY